MRRFQMFLSVSLLSIAGGVAACDDGDDGSTSDSVGDGDTSGDGDGDGESTTGDGDGDGDGESTTEGGCYPQPEECAMLIECLDVILPGTDLTAYADGGSCWCGTEAEAIDCYNECADQLATAIETNYMGAQTVGVCHGRYCPLEELNADEPYGPPPCDEGTQLDNPAGVAGSYCAPNCGGIANDCPEHTQTIAQGNCMFGGNPDPFCGLQCFVDPFIYPSGTQCHCGATCQPSGAPDGDGNARGVCTFE